MSTPQKTAAENAPQKKSDGRMGKMQFALVIGGLAAGALGVLTGIGFGATALLGLAGGLAVTGGVLGAANGFFSYWNVNGEAWKHGLVCALVGGAVGGGIQHIANAPKTIEIKIPCVATATPEQIGQAVARQTKGKPQPRIRLVSTACTP